MRDLVILAAVVGAIWFGARQCGFIGGDEEAVADAAADGSGDVEANAAGSAGESSGAAGAGPGSGGLSGAASEAQALVDAELLALLAGEPVGDREGLTAASERSGGIGKLARGLLDSRSPDAGVRWLGLSRVFAVIPLQAAGRIDLSHKVQSASREALALPSASVTQVVRGGDSLSRVRKRFRSDDGVVIAVGLLRWLNGISGDLIHPNDQLRAPKAPVRLVASKSGFWIRLQVGDGILREFPIAIGKEGKTPTATFVMKAPLEHPPWKDPVSGNLYHYGDPEYAIGTRWIGFEPNGPHRGLGIHGTNEPDSIGTQASLGCLRLRNADVEQLAALVAPGMKIEILD